MMQKQSPILIAILLPFISACQALQEPQAASNTQAELEKMQQAAPAPITTTSAETANVQTATSAVSSK